MQRDYSTGNDVTGVTYFTGVEIEHTPAYNKRTLFVVGAQSADEVIRIAHEQNVEHIYLGANMSFALSEIPYGTEQEQASWDSLVFALLKENFWVTLDFDIKYVTYVIESGYAEYRRFIPMISAKLPYINQLGYNACLKLDDTDFNVSNPGVWVHRVHTLMDPKVFTEWDQYTSDNIIK
jgi:hypothetical protein